MGGRREAWRRKQGVGSRKWGMKVLEETDRCCSDRGREMVRHRDDDGDSEMEDAAMPEFLCFWE